MTVDKRAGKEAHKLSVLRVTGLQTAVTMLGGQQELADRLSIGVRALRAKFGVERGISYSDLMLTAKGLRERAALMVAHAGKLEALAEGADHA